MSDENQDVTLTEEASEQAGRVYLVHHAYFDGSDMRHEYFDFTARTTPDWVATENARAVSQGRAPLFLSWAEVDTSKIIRQRTWRLLRPFFGLGPRQNA